MCASISLLSFSPLTLHLPCKTGLLCLHRSSLPISPQVVVKPRNPNSSSISSWFSPQRDQDQDSHHYNGWAIVDTNPTRQKKHNGLPTFVLLGIGVPMVALLAHFSLSRKGSVFRFSSPFHVSIESEHVSSHEPSVNSDASVAIMESDSDEKLRVEANDIKREEGKPGRVILPVTVDSTQQEAIMLLKNLKIIEDDVKANELCTRREYARWLVLANSLLERNPKHRILSSIALSGSTTSAFDDVDVEDPDFGYIQSLAEAGIVLSKLSAKSDLKDYKGIDGLNFFPERFISRQDLMNWKAKLEYKVMPGLNEEISRNNIGFMDVREIRSDIIMELFIDVLADNRSILRKVFGQSKRFQPNKPCTKAQAAVALTSGRMTQAILDELSKLEAEKSSRLRAAKEITTELLEKGDIQRRWEIKLEEEKLHHSEMERAYLATIKELDQEKIVQESAFAAYMKEKAALECQKQLLSSLEEEVEEMSKRFASEKAEQTDEQHNIQSMCSELEAKYARLLDAKSILEAEVESLRILRSWIEDEARAGQACAKVLEEVGRRWKWENRSES